MTVIKKRVTEECINLAFSRKFAPRCSVCSQPILPKGQGQESVRIVALDRSFHVECYKCEVSQLGQPAVRYEWARGGRV